MNSCNFVGRMVKEPELTFTQASEPLAIAKFTLAVNKKFKKEGQPDADFLRMIVFGKNAENISKWFGKGSEIELTTHVQTGSYDDKDGKKIYTTDFVVESWGFTGGSKKAEGQEQSNSKGFVPVGTDADDDDLPF